MKKTIVIISTSLALLVVCAGAGYWFFFREDPHISRGKELLSIDDYDSAAKEFKIYLKKEAKDPQAQALLIYALANQANHNSFNVSDVLNINVLLEAYDNPQLVASLDEEAREETRKSVIKIRKVFYEEGIDTKDSSELKSVLGKVADYIFHNEENGPHKDGAAYVLARKNKQAAKDYLFERTKSEKNDEVIDYLARLGSAVLPDIKKIMDDPQHLGRDKMWPIALAVLLNEAAADYFRKFPNIHNVKANNLPKDLRTEQNLDYLNESNKTKILTRSLVEFGADIRDDSTRRDYSLNIHIGHSPDEGEKAMVTLFSFAPQEKTISSRFYLIKGADLKPLKIKRKEVVQDSLLWDVPFVQMKHKGGNVVELAKPVIIEVEEERIGGRPNISVNARVAVKRHKGQITAIDEMDLVHVKFDEEVNGLSEVTVSPEALRGLYKAKRIKPAYEVYTAKYDSGVLEIDDSLTQKVERL